MTTKGLQQDQKYEWIGTFWFAENDTVDPEKFVGKVTYSPENGIRLSLFGDFNLKDFNNRPSSISRKLMHGIAQKDGSSTAVTLGNIFLSIGYTIGGFHTKSLEGSAQFLIDGGQLSDLKIEKMRVEYDDFFDNIFFRPALKEYDALKYGKSPSLTISDNTSIKIETISTGTLISSFEEFDTEIFSHDQPKISDLKKAIATLFEESDGYLFKRKNTDRILSITHKDSEIDAFLKTERHWRLFWEMLIDHPISIKKSHISVQESDDEENKVSLPFLCSFYRPKPILHAPVIHQHLPINIYSFGSTQWNIANAQAPFRKWIEIHEDERWIPVIDGIHRVIKSRRKTIDTTKFMSLVSEIETLLDLLGYAVTNIDTLVEHYACDKWKKEFALLSDSRDKNQSIGKWISEIRNTITHPKSASKKSNGKYLPIVQDELKLQKIYAYVGGLYIKAILSYIGGINNDHLEKYIEQLITNRASFYKIEYT